MRMIRITGKGQIKVKPDMTRITITLEGMYPDYAETLRLSSEDTDSLKYVLATFGFERTDLNMTRITITLEGIYPNYAETLKHSSEDRDSLKDVLAAFGFERTDLKTLSFNVDNKYEGYKDHDTYKQRFVGYRFRHLLKVEFDSDNERLGKIMYALGNCDMHPEFRISYTVKDLEAAKNELLGKAVKDAKEKAAVITSAAGVTLKDIQSIDYSWREIEFEVSPMNRLMKVCAPVPAACEDTCYDMDIEPDDIEVADTVTIVWEIA